MDGIGESIRQFFKVALITGVVGTVLIGTSAYFGGRNSYNRKEVKNKMEWLADHNAVYGNKNGQFDLEEKLGIIKDLKANYKPDQKISFADAKKYISLYDKCTVQIGK